MNGPLAKFHLAIVLGLCIQTAGCGPASGADPQTPQPSARARKALGHYGYVGGIHAATRDKQLDTPIQGTDFPQLYNSMDTAPGAYRIELPNGTYQVRLHFIRAIRQGKPDPKARTDIHVEGKCVDRALGVSDLRLDPAQTYQALVKTYRAQVTDERLDVEFPWGDTIGHALCGIEAIGPDLAVRINCGWRQTLTDPQGAKWRPDELYPIATDATASVPVIKQKGQWVNVSHAWKKALAQAGVVPLMRWHINWAPEPGIMCVLSDRAGNTFVNVAGNGLYRYEPHAGRLSRADGGKYTSLIGYRKLNDGNANDDGFIQVLINPNGQGFYLVSWCCLTQPTDQVYSPDGKTFLNYGIQGRETWDWGTADISNMPTNFMLNEQHHRQGKAFYSTDAGQTWNLAADDGRRLRAMGFAGPKTLIKALVSLTDRVTGKPAEPEADRELVGIHVSTDLGKTWQRVSQIEAGGYRGPILIYKDIAYLPSDKGLILGTENFTRWQVMPGSPPATQPPVFGKTDDHIMVVNPQGFHETRDAGKTWKRILKAPQGTDTFFWDPTRDIFYAGDYNGAWLQYNR
jgi:hypothetical protein